MPAAHNTNLSWPRIFTTIILLGILLAALLPRCTHSDERERVEITKMRLELIGNALNRFYADNGFYPTTLQGLAALVKKPHTNPLPKNYPNNGYLEEIPFDPWGNAFRYMSPAEDAAFELLSYGADGVEKGDGFYADIVYDPETSVKLTK